MMAGSTTASVPNAFCRLPAAAISIAAFVLLCACACLIAPQLAAAQSQPLPGTPQPGDFLNFQNQLRPADAWLSDRR
jgi:hypothetical protein